MSHSVDPLDRVAEIIGYVEAARSVPMSANCFINRGELLAGLEILRGELPAELQHATAVIQERDQVIAAGQREGEQIVAEAVVERNRRIAQHEITVAAEQEAARIVEEAGAEAQRLRDEVEEYVDTSLANFEQLLRRTLATVERGRGRMTALSTLDGSSGFESSADEKPLPF